jgi:hypothetical protein
MGFNSAFKGLIREEKHFMRTARCALHEYKRNKEIIEGI